jgi:hypothetical protein
MDCMSIEQVLQLATRPLELPAAERRVRYRHVRRCDACIAHFMTVNVETARELRDDYDPDEDSYGWPVQDEDSNEEGSDELEDVDLVVRMGADGYEDLLEVPRKRKA